MMKFYKETNFKQTPIGKIPKEWKVVSLAEVSKEIRTGPFGSQLKKSELSQSGVKVYTQENILKRDFSVGNLYISQAKFEKLKSMEVKPRDVLITIRGTTGASAIFPENAERGIIHTNLAIIRTKEELLPEYLCILINDFPPIASQTKELSSSTTLGALYAKQIKKIKIPLSPIVEQRAIVEVLSVVDLAIQKTDEIIAKTERLKKGLMQTLLTRGIRHKEFKETPIGKIPKTWQIVRLKEIAKGFISGGTPSTKNPKYWNGDIPWIRSIHLSKYYIDEGAVKQYITREGLENSASNIVPKGNLIVATRVGIGKAAVNLIDVAINQDLTGILIDKNKVDPFFVVWYFLSPKIVSMLESFARGTTIKGVAQDYIKELLLPLPPLNEQHEIATILSTMEKKIEIEKRERTRLELIKRGLMDLLLTGKVRVEVG